VLHSVKHVDIVMLKVTCNPMLDVGSAAAGDSYKRGTRLFLEDRWLAYLPSRTASPPVPNYTAWCVNNFSRVAA